jgi:threonine aldolase
MDVDALADAIRPAISDRILRTAMICVENTHTAANGAVLPLEHMAQVKALGAAAEIPVHLDGARIFNAAVASGIGAVDFARHADSVAISLYKGLGAPAGAVLAGSFKFIERGMMYRKMLGGVMRQAGLLAACGLVALRDGIDRLVEDHRTAKQLALDLHHIDRHLIEPREVETNLLTLDVSRTGRTAQQWAAELRNRGVLVGALPPSRLRLLTHREIDGEAVVRCVDAFRALLPRSQPRAIVS